MRALWPLVGCLLFLAASSAEFSSSQCDWKDLEKMKFSPRTIQLRTKNQEEGKLTLEIQSIGKSITESLEHSCLYTLNMICANQYCHFILLNDNSAKISNSTTIFTESEIFLVDGKNLEWSPDCAEGKDQPASDGGDADKDEGGKSATSIWILALIALGVAVTVVAVGILTWSIFSLCRKNGQR